ncbi:NADH-quinone oxidoreductase subunit NuoH [Rubrobacter taiwanensis]|uniref:NADH-quinone oxidoreductase subunit H n=1 Tax=Rubrobacter taiwanensis TaxID=185139 RepID=A0A4R1BP55_9ACTN|nr:NADH-quinone oxidoreductase subunit NuoH [Rubrobacter taiwanensis]TCJ19430.1 NADH-quinone oxidoreductase subunit NuoH [Rubrobacter taiwanensis]
MLEVLNQEPFRFLLTFGALIFLVLNLAAVLTLAERKVSAYIQLRYGPNRVGPRGLLQPAADVIKLFTKENIPLNRADRWVFLLAPAFMFLPAVAVWLVIPFSQNAVVADLNIGVLFFVAITSIGALGVIMAGYGSRSSYSLLGALRGAAQMISYEVPLILSLLGVVMLTGSLALSDVVNAQGGGFWNWYIWPQLPMFLIFFISGIAEVKRIPFDLPEGESEIVGGFMIEYSGMTWALIQASEFAMMAVVSAVTATLFLGGWQPPLPFLDLGAFNWLWFAIKTTLLLFVFQWIRWSIPRFRMDQLMDLGWKVLIPLTLIWIFVTALWMLIF